MMLDSFGSGVSPKVISTTFGAVWTSAPSAGIALCGSAWAAAVEEQPEGSPDRHRRSDDERLPCPHRYWPQRRNPIARLSALSATATMIAMIASVVAPDALVFASPAVVDADCALASALAAR